MFRTTLLLYMSLLLAQLVFAFTVLFLITTPGSVPNAIADHYFWLSIAVPLLMAASARFMNGLRQSPLANVQWPLAQKLAHYRTTVLLRSAILEGGNLFCLVVAFLTRSMMPLLGFSLGLLLFVYFRPKLQELVDNYQLTGAERHEVEKELVRANHR